jgi:hypothetical protein
MLRQWRLLRIGHALQAGRPQPVPLPGPSHQVWSGLLPRRPGLLRPVRRSANGYAQLWRVLRCLRCGPDLRGRRLHQLIGRWDGLNGRAFADDRRQRGHHRPQRSCRLGCGEDFRTNDCRTSHPARTRSSPPSEPVCNAVAERALAPTRPRMCNTRSEPLERATHRRPAMIARMCHD